MMDDYWNPDGAIVDRRPPDEEEFGFDTAYAPDRWTVADSEPGIEEPLVLTDWAGSDEWAADVASSYSVDRFLNPPEPSRWKDSALAARRGLATVPRAVLVTATATAGAIAILVAVLRRRS